MLNRIIALSVIFAAALSAAGCAHAIQVAELIPPQIDVRGVRNVVVLAVLEDNSLEGREAVRDLADLMKLQSRKSGVFRNVSEEVWDSFAQAGEGNTSVLPTVDDLKKVAAKAKADAVLMVRILDFDAQILPPSPFQVGVSYGQVGRYGGTWVDWESPDAFRILGALNAEISLIRAKSGEEVSQKRIPVRLQRYSYSAVGARDLVYTMASEAAAKYGEYLRVRAARSARLLLNSTRNEASDRASQAAYNGNWKAAVAIWEELARTDPKDPAPAFNLGVYHEILKDYDTAYNYYLMARKITGVEDAFKPEIDQTGASALAAAILRDASGEASGTKGVENPAGKNAPEKPELKNPSGPAPVEGNAGEKKDEPEEPLKPLEPEAE